MAVYVNESGTLKNSTDYATSGGCTKIVVTKVQTSTAISGGLTYSGTTTLSFTPKFLIGIIFDGTTSGSTAYLSIAVWSSSSGYSAVNKYSLGGGGAAGNTNGNFVALSVSNKTVTVQTKQNAGYTAVIAMG